MGISKYKRTIYGCYLSLAMQAFCVNCAPILFVAFTSLYGLSYTQLGALVLINFLVQIVVDFTMTIPVEKFGFKPFLLLTPILVILGTCVFVLAPVLMTNPYALFVVGTVIFAFASGLLEALVSPIIDNLPMPNKSRAMSLLHCFYGLGQIIVVVLTSLFVYFFGGEKWQIIMSTFLIVPVACIIIFIKAPVVNSKENDRTMPYSEFLKQGTFWLFMLAIITGGVVEMIMAQWASTFFETALGVNKLLGDIIALGAFALFLTIGRLLYAKFEGKFSISKVCILGSLLSVICYLLIALVPVKSVAIIACGLSGLGCSMLWPGTLILATRYYRKASTTLFGALSGGGDIGCGLGPFLVGIVADYLVLTPLFAKLSMKLNISASELGLRAGLIVGVIAGLICIITHIIIAKKIKTPYTPKASVPQSSQ